MLRAELGDELVRRVHGGIDVSPEPRLRWSQRFDDIVKGRIPNDEKIDIALGAELAARRGAEHKRDLNTACQRQECLAKHIGQASRLGKQISQLGKDRRSPIRLEVHLPTVQRARQQSRSRQLFELALCGAHRRAGVPDDLPKVVRLIGMSEQPAKHASTGTAKEQGGRVAVENCLRCSHRGNKCIRYGNDVNGSASDAAPAAAALVAWPDSRCSYARAIDLRLNGPTRDGAAP